MERVETNQATITGEEQRTGKEGDPALKTIKRWLSKRTFQEKLTAVLLAELLEKESEFDEPDKKIGNETLRRWRYEVIRASGDTEYLENADRDEIAVTSSVNVMLPWNV